MDKGRGRGKREKRDRLRSPNTVGRNRKEGSSDSDREMVDSLNASFEDKEEDSSAVNIKMKQSSSAKPVIKKSKMTDEERKGIINSDILPESQVSNNDKIDTNTINDTARPNFNNLEVFYNIDGNLVNKTAQNIDMISDALNNKQSRFEDSTEVEYKVMCKLTKDRITTNKGKNYVKILTWFNNNKIFPKKINMLRFNLAEAVFTNCNEANLCLDTMNTVQDNDKIVISFINNRSTFCRGVISDWPFDIPQLWQEIVNKDEILKMERMIRRIWNSDEKKMKDKRTDNIIITTKGSKSKESIQIFENFQYHLKIRPYIEPVKQCFNCFRYGHLKNICKSQTRCIICGEIAHGECFKQLKCRNCGLDHRSTHKKCPIFEKNKSVKMIMAYNNISFFEAENIINGKENIRETQYDRYNKPKTWPQIGSKSNVFRSNSRETIKPNDSQIQVQKEATSSRNTNIRKDILPSRKYISSKNKEIDNIGRRKQNYKDYYRQFNNRSEDITKERRGIAYNNYTMETENVNYTREVNTDKSELQSIRFGPEDITQIMDNLVSSQEIKNLIRNCLQNTSRQVQLNEPEVMDLEEERIIDNVELKNREIKFQEDLNRARSIVEDIKREYWNNRNI